MQIRVSDQVLGVCAKSDYTAIWTCNLMPDSNGKILLAKNTSPVVVRVVITFHILNGKLSKV